MSAHEHQRGDAALQTLLDKEEIRDAVMRYCRGVDRCDTALVLSAFHEDAVDNHTGVEERVAQRVPAVIERARAGNAKMTSHNITTQVIELDEDVARSEAYLIAYHRIVHNGGELDWVVGARYLDRFERRGGRWAIAHRTVVFDWERFERIDKPPAGFPIAGFFARAAHGARSVADPSYELFTPPEGRPSDLSTGEPSRRSRR